MAVPLLSFTTRASNAIAGTTSAQTHIGYWTSYFTNETTAWEVVDSNSNAVMIKPRAGAHTDDRFVITRHFTGHLLHDSNTIGEFLFAYSYNLLGIYADGAALSVIPNLTTGPLVTGGAAGGGQSSAIGLYRCGTDQQRIFVVDSEDTLLLVAGDGSSGSINRALNYVGRGLVDTEDNLIPVIAVNGGSGNYTDSDFWYDTSVNVDSIFLPTWAPDADSVNQRYSFTLAKAVGQGRYEPIKRVQRPFNLNRMRTEAGVEVLRPITMVSQLGNVLAGTMRQLKAGPNQVGEGEISDGASNKLATYTSVAGPAGSAAGTVYFTEGY